MMSLLARRAEHPVGSGIDPKPVIREVALVRWRCQTNTKAWF